ncbi:zinc finger, CCHC-type containing protein [Tanacetum coccineum]
MTDSTRDMFNVVDIYSLMLIVGHPNDILAKISAIGSLRLTSAVFLFNVLVVTQYNDLNLGKIVETGSKSCDLYLFDIDKISEYVNAKIYSKDPGLSHVRSFGGLCYSTVLNNNDKFGVRSENHERPNDKEGDSSNMEGDTWVTSDDCDNTGSSSVLETSPVLRRSTRQRVLPSKFNDYVSIEPKIFHESSQNPKWIEVINLEMKALHRNNTYVLADLPPGRKTIGCKWIWNIKYLNEEVYVELPPGYYDKNETKGIEVLENENGLCLSQRKYFLELLYWAKCPKTTEYVSGFCLYVCNNLVSWKSKKQATISRSSAESEYRCLAFTTCELIWVIKILKDLEVDGLLPAYLYSNSNAILIARNPIFYEKTKLFEIYLHLVREKVSSGVVKVLKVTSASNVYDIFIKGQSWSTAINDGQTCWKPSNLARGIPAATRGTDRGGEYMDTLYFQSIGIIHETNAPYTPQQNGISERKNRVLKEMVNSMLSYSGLIQGFWVARLPDSKLKTLSERGIECIFVGYAEHSKAFRDEVSDQHSYCFNVEDDPKTFDEAMKSRDVAFWKEAINDEMDSIMGDNTWVLADLPPCCKPLGCKWIFKRKLKVDGTIEKFKARLMDLKTTFLNGELEEEVYMNQPQGFIMPGNENKVPKKQTYITGSTIESEFMALAAAGKEAEWLKNLLLEIPLWVKPMAPISIRMWHTVLTPNSLRRGNFGSMSLNWKADIQRC